MPRIVNPLGSSSAKICIVGEAPGQEEDASGIPFVGSSGKLLNRLLRTAGIDRNECYITNVIKQRPPENDIDRLGEIGLTLDNCVKELKDELSHNSHNIIVPLGNVALQALTSHSSITKYRGSILHSTLIENQKIIPTIHPAAALRQYEVTALMVADFTKIKRESETPGFESIPQRIFTINPTYLNTLDELERLIEEPKELSLDIETNFGATYIKCVGLTDNPLTAFCIPFISGKKSRWTSGEETQIWKRLKHLLNLSTNYKIIQNALFEMTVLYPWVGEISSVYIDTMVAQNLCYPELKKDLGTITSLYTNEPFYKDDAKEGNYEDEALWNYNCKDVCVTLEAARTLNQELEHFKMQDFFHGYIMPLQKLLFRASMKGIESDIPLMQQYFNQVVQKYQYKSRSSSI